MGDRLGWDDDLNFLNEGKFYFIIIFYFLEIKKTVFF